MMKTTADLYSSQLTVKSHSTGRIGGDFAGILLSTLAAAIYNTNVQNQAFSINSSGDQWLLQTAEVHIPAEFLANKSARKKLHTKEMVEKRKAC